MSLMVLATESAASVDVPFNVTYLFWALLLGGLSAVSLPMGSLVGVTVRLSPRFTAAFTAFGGGALTAALAIELVAPTAAAAMLAAQGAAATGGHGGHGGVDAARLMVALLAGMGAGGVLFVVLDQMVNARGGFLRKTVSTFVYLSMRKVERETHILEQLSTIDLLRLVPAEDVRRLVQFVRPQTFHSGELLFNEGDTGDRLYFISEGTVLLEHDRKPFKELHAGDVVGEIALLTGAPRTAQAEAKGDVAALSLAKEDFDRLRQESPELDGAARELAASRIAELGARRLSHAQDAAAWAAKAKAALRQGVEIPTPGEIRAARHAHHGAPLAIWLGILLDGIPESFVIGAGFLAILTARLAAGAGTVTLAEVIPYTLIAGLFLSNFPEAMSSSLGMRAQGWNRRRIFLMWFALMVMTAAGSGVGYVVGNSMPPIWVVGIEGIAAGSMLTLIAAAMIPEAVHLGGPNVAGLGTLAGFLSAVAFKLLG
ncbi:MAG: cyclic nucleotide-binding domain-containing protein [Planctomycetes bacterium]|nr:cyclic nucleotide-binding domain-containing protein [Planctomycetota bacterium]